MDADDTIREGRLAATAVEWIETELNRRYLAASKRVCVAGLPCEERESLLADMRACLALAASAGFAIVDGIQAVKVEVGDVLRR